jgi:hypothetical protein
MLTDIPTGLFFIVAATIATGSWLGGAYSIYRGLQSLPEGQRDVPFFNSDPRLITPEARKWRARIYACMGYFILSLAITLLIRHGH